MCRATEVKAIVLAHHLHFLQSLNLFGHLLAQTDTVFGHGAADGFLVSFFCLNQAVNAVYSQTTVVANDAAAGIVVGQTSEEAQ